MDGRSLNNDTDVRRAYSADVSGLVMMPDAVARPASAEQVQDLLKQAASDRTPVTPAGGQTSTTGSSITNRGILLSLRGMTRIIDLDVATRRVVVEPGVLIGDLNRTLAPYDLHFSPDPTSMDDVTVGGAIACNASGARSLYYGATRNHVSAVDVVLANGDRISVRRSGLEKNTAGYAVAHEPVDWFVGSEGTLGVIVQAELSLQPVPERVRGIALPFPDESSALAAVVAIRDAAARSVVTTRCLEYFDTSAVELARDYGGAPWRCSAVVYAEDVGSSATSEEALDRWLSVAEGHGAICADIGVHESESALRDARRFRHAVPTAMNERGVTRRADGGRKVSTDWAVPFQSLASAIGEARQLVTAAGLDQPIIYGHAGNGHPHENFIAKDSEELAKIERVVELTLRHVVSLGGTVSAEHGIGKIKRPWLALQASPLQIGLMRALKHELDPRGLLAPGNIL